jgi:hypothetical protein
MNLGYKLVVTKAKYLGAFTGSAGFWEVFIGELRSMEKFASIRS